MGVDLLDIMFRLEKAFHVRLNREDFQLPPEPGSKMPRYRTKVRDLYQIVIEKRSQQKARRGSAGLDGRALEEVCWALATVLDVPRERIGGDDSLTELIPEPARNRSWRQLKRRLQLELPDLKIPRTLYQVVWWSSAVAVTLIAYGTLWVTFPHESNDVAGIVVRLVVCAVFCTPIGAVLAGLLTTSHAWHFVEFPEGLQTVRDLAHSVLALNRKHFVELCESDPDDDVWESLRFIVADVLAVDPAEVAKEADLFEDLGAE